MEQFVLEGNLTQDPVLRYTPKSNVPVCEFSVAVNRRYEKDGQQVEEVSFYDVTAWRDLGENLVASCKKGDRVLVQGRTRQDRWEDAETNKTRSRIRFEALAIGPSLRWATATPHKTKGNGTRPNNGDVPPDDFGEEPF